MKILLTGEIGIGKSTVLTKTLNLLEIPHFGFKTFFNGDRSALCMGDIGKNSETVAKFESHGCKPVPIPEAFEIFGVLTLAHAVKNAKIHDGIIVMDELGFLESSCEKFKSGVKDILEGDIPVLGVIKKRRVEWLSFVCENRDILLIEVGSDNRDALPGLIYEYVMNFFEINRKAL